MARAKHCSRHGSNRGRPRHTGAALAFISLLCLTTHLAADPRVTADVNANFASSPTATGTADSVGSANNALAPRVLVEPLHQATVSSEIDGRVERLPFRSGDVFHKGNVLVRFDCTIYRAQQQAAQAVLDQAQEKLRNDQQLAKLNSIGDLDVALDQAAVNKAQAEVRIVSAHVNGCTIRAPYNGRVIARKVHEHENVPAGKPLLQILDDTGFTLTVIIPSSWLAWVRPGTRFTLHIDDTDHDYPAHVTVLGAQVDPVSQTIKVRAKIDGATTGLIAGMGGAADFSAARPKSKTSRKTR